jgi:hypothetical protein
MMQPHQQQNKKSNVVQEKHHYYKPHEDREYVNIHDDVYNMFFLSNFVGYAFFYSLYVCSLKMALYVLSLMEVMKETVNDIDTPVFCAKFLVIPVAVAMQDDLMVTFFLIANIKYCTSIKNQNPEATVLKFYIATACRAIDGFFITH